MKSWTAVRRWRPKSIAGRHTWLGILSVVTVLVAWESAVRLGALNPLYASSPSRIAIAAAGLSRDPAFYDHLRVSGLEFLIGFGAAVALGTPLGLLAGSMRRLGYAVEPTITAAYVTPRSSLLPVLVLWFGFGPQTTTIVVFLGSFFVLFLYSMAGAKTADPQLVRAARSFSASRSKIFRTIILPNSVPHIITGFRLGVGRALIGVVIGEVYAASVGLGYLIHVSGITLQIDKMFVAIIAIATAGLASNLFFSTLERRFSAWRPILRET